jgi:hypothetical protein
VVPQHRDSRGPRVFEYLGVSQFQQHIAVARLVQGTPAGEISAG